VITAIARRYSRYDCQLYFFKNPRRKISAVRGDVGWSNPGPSRTAALTSEDAVMSSHCQDKTGSIRVASENVPCRHRHSPYFPLQSSTPGPGLYTAQPGIFVVFSEAPGVDNRFLLGCYKAERPRIQPDVKPVCTRSLPDGPGSLIRDNLAAHPGMCGSGLKQ